MIDLIRDHIELALFTGVQRISAMWHCHMADIRLEYILILFMLMLMIRPGLPVWHTACHRWDCARGRRTRGRRRSRRGWGGSPPSWSSPTSATSTPSPSLSPPPLSTGGGGGGEETRTSCSSLAGVPAPTDIVLGDPRRTARESRTGPSHLSLHGPYSLQTFFPRFFFCKKRWKLTHRMFSWYFSRCHFICCANCFHQLISFLWHFKRCY